MGAPARPVALTGANQQAASGFGKYIGYTVRNTSGGAGVLRIWDGTSATGTLLDVIQLTAGAASTPCWYGPEGQWFTLGVFVEVVSGTWEGSVRIG